MNRKQLARLEYLDSIEGHIQTPEEYAEHAHLLRNEHSDNTVQKGLIMGTNYYLHQKGRPFESMHIGKSSAGWCFSLHVMPEDNINTLDDWRNLWAAPGAFIRDEYGEKVSIADMERGITERHWRGEFPQRHDIDGHHCIGHGEGTWDYITGEFC